MATFEEFIASIQADGNDGKAFEHFCKWFLLNDPYWKTQVDKAWLFSEWPDRWGPDNGIDLIFKHKNGEMWALQFLIQIMLGFYWKLRFPAVILQQSDSKITNEV